MADAHDLTNGTPLYLIKFGPDEWWECVDEGEDGDVFTKGEIYQTALKRSGRAWGLQDRNGDAWVMAMDARFKPADRPSKNKPNTHKSTDRI